MRCPLNQFLESRNFNGATPQHPRQSTHQVFPKTGTVPRKIAVRRNATSGVGDQVAQVVVLPTFRVNLPSLVILSGHTLTDTPRDMSPRRRIKLVMEEG